MELIYAAAHANAMYTPHVTKYQIQMEYSDTSAKNVDPVITRK